MRGFHYGVAVAALATAGLCIADLKTDYDHNADFGRYHTYSWIQPAKANDSLWSGRITSDVDSALSAKGWQKVPSGGDASVSAFGSTRNQKTLQTYYDGMGGGWGWRGFGDGMATTTVENTPEGTLVVDIFDSNTKKLIWRGVDTKSLSGNPEKNIDKLAKAVEDMFKKFPPASKG
jgi:hypothetical protein